LSASRLTRWFRPGASIVDRLSRLERQIEHQRDDIRSLTAMVRKQAGQLKELREHQARTDERWRAEIDQLAKALAAMVREHGKARVTDQRQWRRDHEEGKERHKLDAKWRTGLSWQVSSLVRKLYLPADVPYPFKLAAQRFKLRSQHEEDGYLLAILDEIGVTDRRFVEIGCGRSGGNAALLAFEMGWAGLMVDANPDAIEYIDRMYAFNDTLRTLRAEITPDNINPLLADHGFAGEIDLLSIDIDSYDYWVFDKLEVCSPRLLILEYNAGFGPTRSVTIPLGQPLAGSPKGYSGASITALTNLAARKGYRLIACEYSGANAFFLRDDVAPHIPAQPVARAFRPQMSRLDVDQPRAIGTDELYRRIEERGLPLQDV